MAFSGPPTVIADGLQKKQMCKSCDKRITAGQVLGKDFETGWWIHYSCVIAEMMERHGPEWVEEHERRVQHFRDAVVDAVRCKRCGSGIGAECRELGVPRRAVHTQRIRAAEADSVIVVASNRTRSLTTS